MQRDTLVDHGSASVLSPRSWLLAALLVAALLVLLLSSGALLTPLVGHAGTISNYVHEFTHDGRHLLAVPCH